MQFLLIVEAIAAAVNSNNVSQMIQLVESLISLGEQMEASIKNSLEAQPAAPAQVPPSK